MTWEVSLRTFLSVIASAAVPDGAPGPKVVAWQHRYCAFMAVVYVLCVAGGVLLIVFRHQLADEQDSPTELLVMGVILAAVSAVMAIAFGAAPFLPAAPWVWIYHLVLMALTMTSMCCLPFAIPLLIGWIKPETKAYFGRS